MILKTNVLDHIQNYPDTHVTFRLENVPLFNQKCKFLVKLKQNLFLNISHYEKCVR